MLQVGWREVIQDKRKNRFVGIKRKQSDVKDVIKLNLYVK
jgi:hypothetical protein